MILLRAEVASEKFLPNLHLFVFEILAVVCILNTKAILFQGCISMCYFFTYQNLVSS